MQIKTTMRLTPVSIKMAKKKQKHPDNTMF